MRGFDKWLDDVLESDLPPEIVAVNFNLYDDGDGQWSIEFVGADSFDEEDSDWACDEVFTTRDDPFCWESEASWEEIQEEAADAIKAYLDEGAHAEQLKQYEAVGVGFVDGELDSIMNYPFRTAIIQFLRGNDGGSELKDTVMSIVENYPPQVLLCNMNLLGTHDTPRILTWLVDDFEGTREEYSKRHISRSRLDLAYERLMMASFIQYMLPGSPSLYYGDEAGMEGHKDPFNRRTYPWGHEEPILMAHFKALGAIRKREEALRLGDIQFFHAGDRRLGFSRTYQARKLRIYVNRNADAWDIPSGNVLLGHNLQTVAPDWLSLGHMGFCITEER